MDLIDNSPTLLGTVQAFRENDLQLNVDVSPDVSLDLNNIVVEIWDANKVLYTVTDVELNGQIITVNVPKAIVKVLPSVCQCFIKINGNYTLGYKLVPHIGFGFGELEDNTSSVFVNLKGEKGDPGEVTQEFIDLAEQVSDDAAAVAAVANADVVVATYNLAVPLFSGSVKRTIFVTQAGSYNDAGDYFIWYPLVQKEAYMGLDFDYKTI